MTIAVYFDKIRLAQAFYLRTICKSRDGKVSRGHGSVIHRDTLFSFGKF